MKINPFEMTGVLDPRPGISFFQRMFFVSLHSSGGAAAFDAPVLSGPRHCGHWSSSPAGMAGLEGPAADRTMPADAARASTYRKDERLIVAEGLRGFLRHPCGCRFGPACGSAPGQPREQPPECQRDAGPDEERATGGCRARDQLAGHATELAGVGESHPAAQLLSAARVG